MIKFADLIFLFRKSSSNKLIFIWAFFFFTQPTIVSGQSIDLKTGLQVSLLQKGNAFWHHSNQLGIIDQGGYISLSKYGVYNKSFDYGLSGIGNFNEMNNSELLIGFVSKNIKDYTFKIGRWQKNITAESNLSTGSLIRGNNAIPIPQISFSLPEFKKYTFFNQQFWIKGGFTHGWFSKGSYIKSPLLHEKYFYLKFFFTNKSFFTIGLVHEAMWGGQTSKHGKQPQSFKDFLTVVLGRSASNSGYIGEQVNVLGNHLGIWDLSYSIENISKVYRFYYQHPFEDKSGMYQHFLDELKKKKLPLNSFDGLYGIEIKNKYEGIFSSFLYEYLNTMYQSGTEPQSDVSYGWDGYFNHYIYDSGWTNYGNGIGNPLFTVGRIINYGDYIINNRIKAHHIGLQLNISNKIKNKILITYTKNYGTFWDELVFKSEKKPYPFSCGIEQWSGLVQFDFQHIWKNVNGSISYAFDRGDLYPDSDSFLFSINYHFPNL